MSEFPMNLVFPVVLILAAEDLIQFGIMGYSQWYLDSCMRFTYIVNTTNLGVAMMLDFT